MIPKFYETISNDLSSLEKKLVEYLLTPNEPTNQVLSHIFSSGELDLLFFFYAQK